MITVMEPVGMVEICITTDSPLARSIVVTAETGPKSGAANQATGSYIYSYTCKTWFTIYLRTTIELIRNRNERSVTVNFQAFFKPEKTKSVFRSPTFKFRHKFNMVTIILLHVLLTSCA